MRWFLQGLIFCIGATAVAADFRASTPAPVPLTDSLSATSALPHPSPVRSPKRNTTRSGGSEPISMATTAMPSPEQAKLDTDTHGRTTPARNLLALFTLASGPQSPDKSPKRRYDEGEEDGIYRTVPGSASSTEGSPKRTRSESTPVGPSTKAAFKTLDFGTSPITHLLPVTSPACSSGYASTVPQPSSPHTPGDYSGATTPHQRSSSSLWWALSSRLSQRRSSNSSISPAKPSTPPTPHNNSSVSPTTYGWAPADHAVPKTPVALSRCIKSMDIATPRTTSLEYQLLATEQEDLRKTLIDSPAGEQKTKQLLSRWQTVTDRKKDFEEQFMQAADRRFAPRIAEIHYILEQQRHNPTYAGAVALYNHLIPLQEELSAWSGSDLYTKLTHFRTDTDNHMAAAQELEKAAGRYYQTTLAGLLDAGCSGKDFATQLAIHKDSLQHFKDDIAMAQKQARHPWTQEAFAALAKHTKQFFSDKQETTAAENKKLLQQLIEPTSWSEALRSLKPKHLFSYIGSFLNHKAVRRRTLSSTDSTDPSDRHQSSRPRYDSGCSADATGTDATGTDATGTDADGADADGADADGADADGADADGADADGAYSDTNTDIQ